MPIIVNQMESDVSVNPGRNAGDSPMSEEMIGKLVQIVLERVEQQRKNGRFRREIMQIRNEVSPGRAVDFHD